MKKSSSNPVQSNMDQPRVQPWTPSQHGAGAQQPMPSFVIPDTERKSDLKSRISGGVLKNQLVEETDFSSWLPSDLMPVNVPAGFSGAVSTWLQGQSPALELDPREDQVQQLIHQAQQQAEMKIMLEQEQSMEKARSEARKLLESAGSVINSLKAARKEMLVSGEEQILDLVLDIARSLFSEGLHLDKPVLERVLRDALQEARELGSLRIHLNPSDLDILDPHWPEGFLGDKETVILLPDPGIKPGGCLVEGEYGQIDARIETKLEAARAALLEVLNHQAADRTEEDES